MSIKKIKERKAATAAKSTAKKTASGAKAKARNSKMAAMDHNMMEMGARNAGASPREIHKVRQDNAKHVKQTNDFYQKQFSDKKSPLSRATAKAKKKK